MIKYIAKPDTWFKEGTECILEDDFRTGHVDSDMGLFRGIYIVGSNEGYDTYWYNKGYKEGDEVEMNEVCPFDEFDIIDME